LARWFRARRALLLAIVFLRAPGLVYGVVDIDETDWLTYAQLIRRGALFYVDIVEKKPPLGYYLYALLSPLGYQMWPAQLLAMGWVFLTCLVVGRAVREWTGSEDAGWIGAWLCAIISACNTFAVSGELMLNLPASLALLFFVRGSKAPSTGTHLLAGIALGLAAAFKHQAGILLVALGVAALAERAILRALLLGFGFAVPWAVLVAIWLAAGKLDAFVEWNITRNLFYAGLGAGSPIERAAEGIGLFAILAAPLPWALAVQATLRRESLPAPARLGLLLSLWMSWIPVALGGRFYAHYFLQLAPPLAIIAAPPALALLQHPRRGALAIAALLPLLLFQGIALGRQLAGDFPCQDQRTIEIATWLRENTKPDDRLFVWGHYSPIYYLADRLPGTRYLNTSVHMGDYDPAHLTPEIDLRVHHSESDVRATLEDLEKNAPAICVDTSPADIHHWSKIPLESFPEIDGYVHAHYTLAAHAGGAAIYRRN
jgi:4-amino-4-deoxy-L-arabinose transferase-like glycosyltransferase